MDERQYLSQWSIQDADRVGPTHSFTGECRCGRVGPQQFIVFGSAAGPKLGPSRISPLPFEHHYPQSSISSHTHARITPAKHEKKQQGDSIVNEFGAVR